MGLGGGVEGDGEGIGPGASTGGVGAPAAGGEPAVAGTGGVAVDGDEDDVLAAQLSSPFVYTAAALWGGNRLWQVVKRDYLFCRIHCFLVLSETMASYFVATEKETRSPL